MSTIKKTKIHEKKSNELKKSTFGSTLKIKVSLSPVLSTITSPAKSAKNIKSQSNVYELNRKLLATPKTPKSSSSCKISIKCIEKKTTFPNKDDDLSPIISRKSKGLSMTEEEYKEIQLILKNL